VGRSGRRFIHDRSAGEGAGISASAGCASRSGTLLPIDHFSLARVGIPSFSIGEGLKFKGHDEAWGEAEERDYVEHRYHQPTDEYLPGMDFTGDAKMAMFGYELGVQAASQPKLIGWQPAMSSMQSGSGANG